MRIFVAGASGVLGSRVVPLLVSDGHEVAGMTRTPSKVRLLGDLGAIPVVCDVFALAALREAVGAFRPDLLVHLVTDLPDDAASIPQFAALNGRVRTEGTRNLLEAAGAARVVAQSVAWALTGAGAAAVAELESSVLGHGGVVLRYGQFYGPGTYYEAAPPAAPRVAIETAAVRTVEALAAPTGVTTIVDDVRRASPDGEGQPQVR